MQVVELQLIMYQEATTCHIQTPKKVDTQKPYHWTPATFWISKNWDCIPYQHEHRKLSKKNEGQHLSSLTNSDGPRKYINLASLIIPINLKDKYQYRKIE
jgi:hypothetical protein